MAGGARRPLHDRAARDPARSGRPGGSARAAAAGRPARLPRHGDDRARDGDRDCCLPRRPRLVGGRRLPPGPAAAPRSCRRTGAADRPGRLHPARRLVGDLQRPGVRLAAARHPLPHGPPRRPAPRRPPRPAAGRPPALPPPAGGRAPADRRNGRCSGWSATATSTARRSPGGTSASCAAGRPNRSPRSSATTTRTSARSRACWSCSPAATGRREARRTRAGRRPRRPRPGVRSGGTPRARRSSATTSRFEPSPAGAGPLRSRSRCGRSTRGAVAGTAGEVPWWSPRVPAGLRRLATASTIGSAPSVRSAAFATPWTTDRIAVERAHLLRRLRRWDDAADAWASLAAGPGRTAIVAAIELAKLREHRLRDPLGALRATGDGLALAERRQRLGRPGAATGGRPARPRSTAAATSRRADRDLSPAADQRQTRVGGLALTSATEHGRVPDRTSRPSCAGRRPAR